MRLKRVSAAHYETEQGHLIDYRRGNRHLGTSAGWFITWPGQRTPDVGFLTLREARQYIEREG